jgi:hypothetical protein
VPGGERKEKEERDQQKHEPQKDVQGAASRGNENDANGLHEGRSATVCRSGVCRERA